MQILLLLIVTYNDREARGEQCYVVWTHFWRPRFLVSAALLTLPLV